MELRTNQVGPFLGSTPVDAPAVCVISFTFTMKMHRVVERLQNPVEK
jgi:hypothetical protein